MNRAQLLLSVLRDGRPHSRTEVFERVGFMLTNNAASELRAQGYDVQHVYRLLSGEVVRDRAESSDQGIVGNTEVRGMSCPGPSATAPESSLSKIGAAACADGSPEGDISPAASMYPLPEWSGGAALTVPPDQLPLWDAA